jgi:hypothetical protein
VSIRDELPAVYARLLPEFFDSESVVETKATCNDCAMCAPKGTPASASSQFFRPDTKCCTYTPRLANFLVGAVLADETPEAAEGRRRVQARIAGRVVATPRWLAPSAKYSVVHDAARRASFGRSTTLLCPYYQPDGGLCTIWRHRDSACLTFFCKYVAGADGLAYWRALSSYLGKLETAFAAWSLKKVAPELTEPTLKWNQITPWELEDRPPPEEEYAGWWGKWLGREEELYRACFEEVRALGTEEARAIVEGEEHKKRLHVVSDCHREVNAPTLPERLARNPELDVYEGADGARVVNSYWIWEPTVVPAVLYDLVGEFSARETVSEVKRRIHGERGIELPDELVLQLYQLRILVAAKPPATP